LLTVFRLKGRFTLPPDQVREKLNPSSILRPAFSVTTEDGPQGRGSEGKKCLQDAGKNPSNRLL